MFNKFIFFLFHVSNTQYTVVCSRQGLQQHNDTVSGATNTSVLETTLSKLTLPSPLPPARLLALFITSSLPSPSSHSLHPPISILFHLPPKPPVVILDPPLPAYPTFSSPLPTPLVPSLAPLFPISLSVCSYPADLCPSCRCWFAHPAPLANMTKRDPQYSNRHTAFKCRMAGSTWVQL